MQPIYINILSLVIAFLLGSIPFGLIVAKIFKVPDLQKKGSGNIGATNVSRVLGFWPAGFLTFLFDFLKGFIPALLATPFSLAKVWGLESSEVEGILPYISWWIGLISVIGHCYTPWLNFNGGKGVATGVGVLIVLSPFAGLFGLAAFAFTFFMYRLGSLASIAGLFFACVGHLVFEQVGFEVLPGGLLILLILLRHEKNIEALLVGTERRF